MTEPLRLAVANAESVEPRPPEFSDDTLALPSPHRNRSAERGAARVFDQRDPLAVAKWIAANRFARLIHHRGEFFKFAGTRFEPVSPQDIRSAVYEALDGATTEKGGAIKPTARLVSDIVDALKYPAHLSTAIEAPAWLDGHDGPPAAEFIAMRSGLLRLPTRELYSHTPDFFNVNGVDFDYDLDAGDPKRWLEFLDQLWPDDPASIDTLQEIFGHCLTGDTSQQKAFMVIGPRRSGKGTIARVATRMIGAHNVCGPTLNALASNFGLSPMIGKRLAIIADARLSGRADQSAITERLLSISGEDALTIDRKFRDAWTGRLGVRFLILTNEIPRFADSSGALSSRFIVLRLERSFLNREDPGLTDQLLHELPAIFNWALAGLDRLRARGRFEQPKSAADIVGLMEQLASPILTFIADCCETDPLATVECGRLYEGYRTWCGATGREHPGTVQTFGRDLRAALPALAITQHRAAGAVDRYYNGIRLKD